MRNNKLKSTALIIVLVFSIVLMASTTVYAAFVYQSRAKRVVSTKASDDIRFSSNIMTKTYDGNDPAVYYYSVDENTEYLNLNITVCNFAKGQMNYVNPEKIEYNFSAEIVPDETLGVFDTADFSVNGVPFTDKTYTTDTQVLPADTLTQHEYAIRLPKLGNDWNSYSLVVKAVPVNNSATSGYMLCKKIVMTKAVVHTMGWKGEFTDSKSRPSTEYYGFNYRISGGGHRTLRLSWNSDYLELNPEFMEQITGSLSKDGSIKTFTFEVGKNGSANDVVQDAYTLQFYRVNESIPINEKWDDIESYVKLEVSEGGGS